MPSITLYERGWKVTGSGERPEGKLELEKTDSLRVWLDELVHGSLGRDEEARGNELLKFRMRETGHARQGARIAAWVSPGDS